MNDTADSDRRRAGATPLAWCVWALALILTFTACADASDSGGSGRRAVVIGIDGADWKVIDALAARGELPHLTSLRERGVWGEIETLNDIPLSPVIWTSVATGKSPAKHGISWFMVDQPDGTRVPVRSHEPQERRPCGTSSRPEAACGPHGDWLVGHLPGRGRGRTA